jgi:hypothetical protein
MEDPTHVSESDVRMSGGGGSAAAGGGSGGAGLAPVELTAHMFPETDAPALHIRVAVPSDAARKDVCCLLLVDTSGSMSTPCTLKDGSAEGASFCSLDLVMHAARTLGRSLTIHDTLGVIAFSDAASVVMPPRPMGTDEAVEILDASLAALRPSGMTNVWDAVRTAAQLVERMATDRMDVHVLLLTDGAANINPSVGLVRAVQDLGAAMARPWTLHCFGFGSMADTATLQALAADAGIVGFIPDASMVGTTFINFAAMLLTLVRSRVRVQLERDGTEPVVIDMGSLCAGQPRDAVVRLLPGTKDTAVRVRVLPSHGTSASTPAVPVILAGAGTPLPADPFLRLRLLEVVEASIAQLERGPEHVDTVCANLRTVHAVAATWPAVDGAPPFGDGVCRDIVAREKDEGQLCLAPNYVYAGTRWGVHYLRSYASALRHQFRANFKDRALQCFGGAPFDAVQRVAAAIFDNMPAARPITLAASVAYVPPASMAAYNNAAGGCFNPYTLVRMADGGLQHVCDLKRGDEVMTYAGRTARVDFVVEYNSRRAFPLYTVRHSLYISPWHPVRDGDDGDWTFPAERPDSVNYDEGWHTVFNLVLSCDHVITLENGLQAVTLGHGLRGPVVSHPYFGSMEAIMADLIPLRGFDHGRPRFRKVHEQRCAHSGIVCGMIDEDAEY